MKQPLAQKIIRHGSFLCCLFLFLMTVVAIPQAGADEEEPKEPQCVGGESLDDIKEIFSESGTVIITELTEPMGNFDQTIESESGQTVSAVYWKYNCYNVLNESMSLYRKYNDGCPDGMSCTTVQLVVGTSGIGILKTYIAIIYRWAAGIVGIIAVLVMIISGIQISMDQGSGEAVGAAKTRILQSLAGLAVLFLSALILYTINPTFFTQ